MPATLTQHVNSWTEPPESDFGSLVDTSGSKLTSHLAWTINGRTQSTARRARDPQTKTVSRCPELGTWSAGLLALAKTDGFEGGLTTSGNF
jgi:hypothetical protein